MAGKLTSYEKAGRVFRLFGWLQLTVGGLITIAILITAVAQPGDVAKDISISLLILGIVIGVSVFQLFLGKAIKEHKDWARVVGIVVAVLQLFGFPIGTLIGAYILWCLIGGWDVPADGGVEQAAAADASRG